MHRIQLDNAEFEGKNDVYLLGDDTLIDAGIATSATREQLRDGLARHDVSVADVDRVFLTHWHADHAGLAGEIQRESGATVYAHEADAPLLAQGEAWDAMKSRQRSLFADWGMPDAEREELLAFLESHEAASGEPIDVESFADGDRFDVGDRRLEVVHAPGHTAGLSMFAFEGADGPEAFAGDALLPRYTPNVGGADVRVTDPLGKYLETLQTVVDREFERAYPGHRDPIDDPTARAGEIVDHHRERTERVLDVLSERGPADAWTVSAELFGDLAGIHVMHGPGEAYAHLDHLERHGVVERTSDGYRVVDRAAVDAVVPDAAP